MQKKILLVFQSPSRKCFHLNRLPPLGILGISSYLTSKGITNMVLDCNIDCPSKIDVEQFDIIAFSINVANVVNTLNWAKQIKERFLYKQIIVGGPLCNADPHYFIEKEYIDAVVVGEGEETCYEYLVKDDLTGVKGLYIKDKGKIVFTGEREFIEDLDSLPFPALDKVDIDKYNRTPKKALPISGLITSRGCPFECTFCFHSLGYKWRPRSPENVVKEIEWQVNSLKVKELSICDDNFAFDKERAERICDLILERNIKVHIQFPNGIYLNRIDKKLLTKLKESGTHYIGIAAETGNINTMHRIKKYLQEDKVKQVVAICKELKLKTLGFYILGFPWESLKEAKNTIEFAAKVDTDLVQFTRLLPYKKTPLYDWMVDTSILLSDKYEEEKSPFFGGDANIRRIIKKAYRNFYFRPRKIINLLRLFSLKDLISLVRYAFITRNI